MDQLSMGLSGASNHDPRHQIERAILFLAGRCDGARQEDGIGFNGSDAAKGHRFAEFIEAGRPLRSDMLQEAWDLLQKYKETQLRRHGYVLPAARPADPPAAAGQGPRLVGRVSRILVQKDGGWALFLVDPEDPRQVPPEALDRAREVKALGVVPGLVQGRLMEFTGTWVDSQRDRGRKEFKATGASFAAPRNRQGVEEYLQTLPGIGGTLARKIYDHLSERGQLSAEEVWRRIFADPSIILKVPGVKAGNAGRAVQRAADERAQGEILTQLLGWGLTPRQAGKAIEKYGADKVAETVRTNPYKLADDIDGIGFKRADEIAKAIGIPLDSPYRVQAGLLFALESATSEGHCYLERQQPGARGRDVGWLRQAVDLLQVGQDLVLSARDALVAQGRAVDEEGRLYHKKLWIAETEVAKSLSDRLAQPRLGALDPERLRTWQQQRKMELAPAQAEAVGMILRSRVAVLTGGPGTGKTTIVRAAVDLLEGRKIRVALAAPTGKAARRLAQTTGREAYTVHRLIGLKAEAEQQTPELLQGVGALLVDEASMVDIALMRAICRALPLHAQLILVGDVDQLPSVGPGAVLQDILLSEAVPVTRLTQVFRQAQGSAVITGAHAINHGSYPELSAWSGVPAPGQFAHVEAEERDQIPERVWDVLCDLRAAGVGLEEMIVLSPQRGSGQADDPGVKGLNTMLQDRLNPAGQPVKEGSWLRVGDRVMQTKNDYDLDVRNGDVGTIAQVAERESAAGRPQKVVLVRFDDGRTVAYPLQGDQLGHLTLGYAVTVHKSQGSEYRAVVMVCTTSHAFMLRRQLLYTGVTRGKEVVVLVGEAKAVALAVRNDRSEQRNTRLMDRLQEARRGADLETYRRRWTEQ